MLDHPNQKSEYIFFGNFHVYLHEKNLFITHFLLKILQRNSKLIILGDFGMHRQTDRETETDRQTEGRTDRQTDRETDPHTHTHACMHACTHTHTHTYTH